MILVVVPFIFVVVVVIWLVSIIFDILGSLADPVSWFFTYAMLLICFGSSLFFSIFGVYRLLRIIIKSLYRDKWVSIYLLCVSLSIMFAGIGLSFRSVFHLDTHGRKPYTYEVTRKKLFGGEYKTVETRYQYYYEQTSLGKKRDIIFSTSIWGILLSVSALAVEFLIRKRKEISSIILKVFVAIKNFLNGSS